LLTVDVVVCILSLQILVDGKERSIIDAYHFSNGIDSCCVGLGKSSAVSIRVLWLR